jgi:hypothetical protein
LGLRSSCHSRINSFSTGNSSEYCSPIGRCTLRKFDLAPTSTTLLQRRERGLYRPWVRVHATKDYYDMAATVAKYPNVHVTFNITPVLIEQLNDFVNNGAKDYYWVLSEKPSAELTDEEKTFILTGFSTQTGIILFAFTPVTSGCLISGVEQLPKRSKRH